jgi:hypothetical protein
MIRQEGSKIIVDSSVQGSVFPTSERELPFAVLVNGERAEIRIEGSLYGRSLELRGGVRVDGPVVSRGDTRLTPQTSRIKLLAGVTVNGALNVVSPAADAGKGRLPGARQARVIIKGDIAVNQSVALRDTIVFGSVRAVNCSLENSVVLGTCLASESLQISGSTIGGYAGRDVSFEGRCMILNALGESLTKPIFLPRELPNGTLEECDPRFYPVVRAATGLLHDESLAEQKNADYARLYPAADWVRTKTRTNPALAEPEDEITEKWVLSLGGRISNLSAVQDSIASLTRMLKCGFEFEHYHPDHRARHLAEATQGLTDEETWLLNEVCVT